LKIALFEDIEKKPNDLLKDLFPPSENNHFESEVNFKNSTGSKVQILTSQQKNGSLLFNLKPTYSFPICSFVNSEFKGSFSSDGKTKMDSSFTFSSLQGLKVKTGFSDSDASAGLDYVRGSLASNLKVTYPLRASKALTVEVASVLTHASYLIGGRFFHNGKDTPEFEAKVQHKCSAATVTLSAKQSKDLGFAVGYFHQVSPTKSIASRFQFIRGSGTFLNNAELSVVGAHQINDNTLVKARFNTNRSTVALGISNTVNANFTVEAGTEFPAGGGPGSFYNFKVIYNN